MIRYAELTNRGQGLLGVIMVTTILILMGLAGWIEGMS